MGTFDHLAIAAEALDAGAAWTEAALGVPLAPGGVHPAMGTHNRLLSLGADEYLEVIAVDPDAPPPGRPRWFGLDTFVGAPRPVSWVLRVDDMATALSLAPEGAGVPMRLSRGDLAWEMAVPADGVLPFDGLFPALIAWQGPAHPADRLPDRGLRLQRLEIGHPRASALAAALAPLVADARIIVLRAEVPALVAHFDTPLGPRVLA